MLRNNLPQTDVINELLVYAELLQGMYPNVFFPTSKNEMCFIKADYKK